MWRGSRWRGCLSYDTEVETGYCNHRYSDAFYGRIGTEQADKKGNVELKEIEPLRDLRIIRGPIEELVKRENHLGTNLDDYIFAELTNDGEILDGISKLRAVFPNIMGLKMVNSSLNEGGSKTAASGNFKEKTLDQLFDEFYFNIKGKEIDEVRKNEVINILEEIEGKVQ